jgi:hypothetical protein
VAPPADRAAHVNRAAPVLGTVRAGWGASCEAPPHGVAVCLCRAREARGADGHLRSPHHLGRRAAWRMHSAHHPACHMLLHAAAAQPGLRRLVALSSRCRLVQRALDACCSLAGGGVQLSRALASLRAACRPPMQCLLISSTALVQESAPHRAATFPVNQLHSKRLGYHRSLWGFNVLRK